MATLIKTDGTTETVKPADGAEFDFRELQELVGGQIETVRVAYQGKPAWMVVNEEGKINRLPRNPSATRIYNRYMDFIVGDAVICLDEDGEIS